MSVGQSGLSGADYAARSEMGGGVLCFVEQVFSVFWRRFLFWMVRREYDPKGGAPPEHGEPWLASLIRMLSVPVGEPERQESPLNRVACHRSSLPPPAHTNTWIDNIVTGTE